MRSTTIVFYGTNGNAAKEHGAKIRAEGNYAQLRHAEAFNGEKEPCDAVVMLPCVTDYDAKRLVTVYGAIAARLGVPVLPPPPPVPVHPLDKLPPNWRAMEGPELRKIAAAVSGGRAVENAKQAIQVIESELAKRAAK